MKISHHSLYNTVFVLLSLLLNILRMSESLIKRLLNQCNQRFRTNSKNLKFTRSCLFELRESFLNCFLSDWACDTINIKSLYFLKISYSLLCGWAIDAVNFKLGFRAKGVEGLLEPLHCVILITSLQRVITAFS